jgi:hypothetical protein
MCAVVQRLQAGPLTDGELEPLGRDRVVIAGAQRNPELSVDRTQPDAVGRDNSQPSPGQRGGELVDRVPVVGAGERVPELGRLVSHCSSSLGLARTP